MRFFLLALMLLIAAPALAQPTDRFGRTSDEVARAREQFRHEQFRGGYPGYERHPGYGHGYGRGHWGPPGYRAPAYRAPYISSAGRFWHGAWYPQIAGSVCWTYVPIIGWTWTCGE